jgi:cystathionine beta-lyase/cystathionine gamma-synthase
MTHSPENFAYARCDSPTVRALTTYISDLEGGKRGFATSSGMGAISVVLKLFQPGDHILVTSDLYGGTYRYFQDYYAKYGYEFEYIGTWDLELVKKSIKENTKAIFIETPSNPVMHVTDIQAVSELAHEKDIKLIVDNTFLTPYFQRPLELGADIVVYSATKYLGGHNDILAGIIVSKTEELGEELFKIYMAEGNNLSAEDAWLMIRSMKTLSVRLDRQEKNALELAAFLKTLPEVEQVHYVGDPDHPQYELSKRQTDGFGAMISFTVKHPEKIPDFLFRFKVITFAESLGGVESLITYPLSATQGPIPEEQRKAVGMTDALLRLSVGLEDVEDLKEDLKQALTV